MEGRRIFIELTLSKQGAKINLACRSMQTRLGFEQGSAGFLGESCFCEIIFLGDELSTRSIFLQIATGFGAGKLHPAPGTWASLAALPLAGILMLLGPLPMMAFVLVSFPLCIIAAEVYLQDHLEEGKDSPRIVIDEVLGMVITLVWMPFTWQSFLIGFCLFRFLDILKPFPVGYLDKKFSGGLGVMIDDVAAGIIANLILQFLLVRTSFLGVQIFL